MSERKPSYWLPRDVRRAVFLLRNPKVRARWNRMMTEAQGNYSFEPFERLRCIFVHIPKAAGMSVCRSLFGNLAGGHTSIAQYQLIFPKKKFDRYFKFTVVRNPWDRLFSAYRFLTSGGMNDADRRFAATHLAPYRDFEDFVLNGLRRREVLEYFHFRPQHTFLTTPHERDPAVDFVGFYENLENDFSYIAGRLFAGQTRPLLHANRTGGSQESDYRKAYTPKMRDAVAGVYEGDVKMLGYAFGNESLETQIASRRTAIRSHP